MKFSNDVDRCEIEETKWVKTTHLFIVRTAMEYAMNFDGISQQLATARCEGWHDSHSYN